jgi:hypothetical protein
MSTHTVHSSFHAGVDVISGRAGRRATAHPRTIATPDTAAAPTHPANPAHTACPGSLSPAGDPQILRRWSVAGLIASAPRPRLIT